MAAHLNDEVYKQGLNYLHANSQTIHICSQQPADYAEVATYTLGNVAAAPEAPVSDANGWNVNYLEAQNGAVTADGDASHYAVVDDTNSALLIAHTLAGTTTVTNGDTFTLTAFKVIFPFPV